MLLGSTRPSTRACPPGADTSSSRSLAATSVPLSCSPSSSGQLINTGYDVARVLSVISRKSFMVLSHDVFLVYY